MLTLYHGATSVCSQKARLALAEKGLEWESRHVDLAKGEQFDPEYLKLNANAVVPTLVHDGLVLPESSAIVKYLDGLGDGPRLTPDDPKAAALTDLWLVRTLAVHEAINSLTFATSVRDMQRANRTPEEIEQWIAALPNPQIRAKRRDLMEHGPESVFVDGALHVFRLVFTDMETLLRDAPFLTGEVYGLTDTALTAYVDRLDRLGLSGLWTQTGFDRIAPWLDSMKQRDSYRVAIDSFIPPAAAEAQRQSGLKAWPVIEKRLG